MNEPLGWPNVFSEKWREKRGAAYRKESENEIPRFPEKIKTVP
jgi:hypothetical protein